MTLPIGRRSASARRRPGSVGRADAEVVEEDLVELVS